MCGGGALIPGLAERVVSEVKELIHPEMTAALCPVPEYMQVCTHEQTSHMGASGGCLRLNTSLL